jgi:hypothetical protein
MYTDCKSIGKSKKKLDDLVKLEAKILSNVLYAVSKLRYQSQESLLFLTVRDTETSENR